MTPTPAEILELLEALDYVKTFRKFEAWRPYPKQRQFFQQGAAKRERIFLAGNQVGKCITYQTLIPTSLGTVKIGDLYEDGRSFGVKSWDGSRLVDAVANPVFRKPAEPCVRVWMADGQWFECALNHRVLCHDGGWRFVRQLLAGVPCLPATTSEPGRSIRDEDARRWFETASDWLGRCSGDWRRYDEPLPIGPALDRVSGRLSCDAPLRSRPSWRWGDPAPRRTSICLPAFDHLSSQGVRVLALARSWLFLAQNACRSVQCRTLIPQESRLLSTAGELALQLVAAMFRGQVWPAEASEKLLADNQIIAYAVVGSQDVYDFEVPTYGNYIAAGVIHHNSDAGAFECACHATGLYPDDWVGKRFDRPTVGWVAGVSSNDVKRVAQRKLCGPPGIDEEWGSGFIPKDCLVDKAMSRGVTDAIDEVQVRHISGRVSRIVFKSYEQGRKTFQGDTIDWGWGDEEAEKPDVYPEFLTRLKGDGVMFTTFTPLFGPTDFVNRFLNGDPDKGVIQMELDEVPDKEHGGHFTKEEREARKAGYLSHERDARAKGIPLLGSGAIFTTPEDQLVEPPLDYIPAYWGKGWGIDFGIGHPFAAALCFWDKDNDVVHVHHTYRARDTLSIVHAAAIKRMAAGVPVFWPKDGSDRDPHGGGTLADGYKRHGLLMFAKHAHWPDGSLGTEAGLAEWIERERTGRIRYAAHLSEMLEERRYYHRKEGQIVKVRDDILSAIRIFIMMKRFCKAVAVGPAISQAPSSYTAEGIPGRDWDLFTGM